MEEDPKPMPNPFQKLSIISLKMNWPVCSYHEYSRRSASDERVDDLEETLKRLTAWSAYPVIALDGMNGLGKSTLAISMNREYVKVNNIVNHVTSGAEYNYDPLKSVEYIMLQFVETGRNIVWDRCRYSNLIFYYVHYLMYEYRDRDLPNATENRDGEVFRVLNDLAIATNLLETIEFMESENAVPMIFFVCSDLDLVALSLERRGSANDVYNAKERNYQLAQYYAYRYFAKILRCPLFDIAKVGMPLGDFHNVLRSLIDVPMPKEGTDFVAELYSDARYNEESMNVGDIFDWLNGNEETLIYNFNVTEKLCHAAERTNGGDAASLFAFVYNVRSGRCKCRIDEAKIRVTPLDNCEASSDGYGYAVCREFYDLTTIPLVDLSVKDLSITMILIAFAEYYANNQYCVMMNAFRDMPEIELLESFINSYGRSSVRLPPNLATDSVYGVRANGDAFAKDTSLPITVLEFNTLVSLMRSTEFTPKDFVRTVSPYHTRIIESLYMLTSITKNCRVIYECRELVRDKLLTNVSFPKITSDWPHRIDWWFALPSKSVWFVYHRERWSFRSYLSRDSDRLMSSLKGINCMVYGVITNDNIMYPIIIDEPNLRGNWMETVLFLQRRNLNCLFERPPIRGSKGSARRSLYFVREGTPRVFRSMVATPDTNKQSSIEQ